MNTSNQLAFKGIGAKRLSKVVQGVESTLNNKITEKNVEKGILLSTWLGPPFIIPALRYTQDSKDKRNEMFVRDFSTYAVGAATLLGVQTLTSKILKSKAKKITEPVNKAISHCVGITAYYAFCGLGAVKMSKLFARNNKLEKAKTEKEQDNVNKMSVSHRPRVPMCGSFMSLDNLKLDSMGYIKSVNALSVKEAK